MNLAIPPSRLESFADEHGLQGAAALERLIGGFDSATVTACLRRLWDAASSGGGSRLLLDQLVAMILVELWHAPSVSGGGTRRGGLAAWQLALVTDYMHANLAREMTLNELSRMLGLSSEHFCRAFKASTGLPPHAWLVQRRVERACELLDGSRLTIEEIASQVGYAEPSHLARVFRRLHGLSPTHYRRERRPSKSMSFPT